MTKKRKRNIIPPELLRVASYGAASEVLGRAKKWFKGKKKNPNLEIEEDVRKLSKDWHGRDVKDVTEVTETETYQEEVADLGSLEELGILDESLEKYAIRFKKVETRPTVCATDVDNIEFIGGDQRITVGNEGVLRDGKKLVPLGYSYSIVYETDKAHLEGSSGQIEPYEHFWAEEFYKESGVIQDDFYNKNGDFDAEAWFEACIEQGLVEEAIEQGLLPMVVYNKTDEKLLLVGGKYEVTELGIKN